MKLSIVIPACDERERIGRMLDAYLPYFSDKYGEDVELIVVVNGSRDGTEAFVGEYAERYPQLRCIVEPRPVGKGAALMIGFAEARGELVGFVDADGSTPPDAFQDLVDRIGSSGAIIASRWLDGAKVSPKQPISRRIASRCFNLLVRILFGLKISDTQCGAKLMRGEALRQVLPNLGLTRWAFDVDLLFQLRRAGHAIIETPTVWHDVTGSKLQVARASMEMFVAMARLRLLYSPFRWVVSIYNGTLGRLTGGGTQSWFSDVDGLLRHSAILFIMGNLGHVCNFFFPIAMSQTLSGAQFGDLTAMLSLVAMVSLPASALSSSVAFFSAGLSKSGSPQEVERIVQGVCAGLLWFVIPLLLIAGLGGPWLAGFFSTTPSLLIVTGVVIAGMLCYYVLGGALLCLQEFWGSSAVGAGWSVVRLTIAPLLVLSGYAVFGALLAQIIAFVVAIILGWSILRRVLKAKVGAVADHQSKFVTTGMHGYFVCSAVVLSCFGFLLSADMVFVKRYLPDLAGLFAKPVMIARMSVFLTTPVAAAMFPKVVPAGESADRTCWTFVRAIVMVLALVLSVAGVCCFFPRVPLWFFGATGEMSVSLVRWTVLAICPLAVLFPILHFEMAYRSFRVVVPLVLCVAVYFIGVAIWHDSLYQVIAVLSVVSTSALIASIACLPWQRMRHGTSEKERRMDHPE